ncbi:unnamed protein product [Spodoptera exigua]|nr:unnamed protein product [Spodoptera exigua]
MCRRRSTRAASLHTATPSPSVQPATHADIWAITVYCGDSICQESRGLVLTECPKSIEVTNAPPTRHSRQDGPLTDAKLAIRFGGPEVKAPASRARGRAFETWQSSGETRLDVSLLRVVRECAVTLTERGAARAQVPAAHASQISTHVYQQPWRQGVGCMHGHRLARLLVSSALRVGGARRRGRTASGTLTSAQVPVTGPRESCPVLVPVEAGRGARGYKSEASNECWDSPVLMLKRARGRWCARAACSTNITACPGSSRARPV